MSDISEDVNPMGLIPFAVSSISPFDSFEVDESDLLPVVNGSSNLRGGAGRRASARRTTRSVVVGSGAGESDGSMRVMYEDPGVAEERRKLMKLMNSGEGEGNSEAKDSEVPEEPLKRSRKTRKNLRA